MSKYFRVSSENVQRIGGKNKYQRNINIINTFYNDFDFNNIYIAYSEVFKSDIVGFYYSTIDCNPIILIGDNDLSIKTNFDFVKNKIKSAEGLSILDSNDGFRANELYGIITVQTNIKN